MKKTMRFLSMAALVLVGAVMTGCSSDDNIIDEPQQPESKKNVVTVKTTVSLGGSEAGTRALDPATGVKTFAKGDKIAVHYDGTDDGLYVAASDELQKSDISADGKTATFTVTLTNPKNGGNVSYIYPYVEYGADFYNGQDGSLDTFQSKFDEAASANGTMTVSGGNVTLPSLTLENSMAALVLTLKNGDGTSTITSSLTQVTINTVDGVDRTYTITPKDGTFGTDKIYVAIYPTDRATITVTATDGTNIYTKKLTNKTYEKGNIYNLGWKMGPTLGDLYYSDGTWSSTLEDGKTPIGIIVYLGNDVYTENGTIVGGSAFKGHGLVMALKNATTSNIAWSTETGAYEFGESARVSSKSVDNLMRTENVSGYTNTTTLAGKDDAETKYPAAYQAKNYSVSAPAGTTGWFMPSAQQWVKAITGLGAISESKVVWFSWFDGTQTGPDNWETALSKAGSGNYDSMKGYYWFWSSSECTADNPVIVGVDARDEGNGEGFEVSNFSGKTSTNRVRPFLAF